MSEASRVAYSHGHKLAKQAAKRIFSTHRVKSTQSFSTLDAKPRQAHSKERGLDLPRLEHLVNLTHRHEHIPLTVLFFGPEGIRIPEAAVSEGISNNAAGRG